METHLIAAGERSKTLETVSSLWQIALRAGLDRQSTLVALGGGVVSDLTGFAAATFLRGCRWVALPTSLLGMVDASLGGKTGVDLPEGKNLAGAFHPPALVLADPELLRSLPERELGAGLAEVVKHGVIADPELCAMCAGGLSAVRARLGAIVRRAAAVKIELVEADPFERGLRAALGFGHTVGHAVEQASGFALPHGEAVAIGMVAEARLAERLAIAEPGTAETVRAVLDALALPTAIPGALPREAVLAAMAVDKKRAAGAVRFSLPERIGAVRTEVVVDDLQEVL